MNKPLVSICIPTYNGQKFIAEAMDAAINQTYRPLEIVVSEDASKDATLEIIKSFQNKTDIPIHIFTHKPSGIGANWNNCIVNSNGEYIKFLFQDDTIESNCIEKMVKYAVKSNNIGLVYSKRNFIYNENDKKNIEWVKLYENLHLSWHKNNIVDGKINKGVDLLKDDSLLSFPENKIGEPTAVLLKKEVFDTVGYFSEVLKQTLDIEFWYRLMKHYDIIFIDAKLVSFRLHDSQATAINSKNYLNEHNQLRNSLYNSLFWYLSFKNKKDFFLKFNTFGKIVKKGLGFLLRIKRKLNL